MIESASNIQIFCDFAVLAKNTLQQAQSRGGISFLEIPMPDGISRSIYCVVSRESERLCVSSIINPDSASIGFSTKQFLEEISSENNPLSMFAERFLSLEWPQKSDRIIINIADYLGVINLKELSAHKAPPVWKNKSELKDLDQRIFRGLYAQCQTFLNEGKIVPISGFDIPYPKVPGLPFLPT